MDPSGANRKLSAILMADVVGYSRLMGRDEDDTIGRIKQFREVFAHHISSGLGRIVNQPGDSILAEFQSVRNAVGSAVEIQRELAERNAVLPDERRMHFRIGINLGDVVSEEDAVYGDGVNIAARLESLAEPGGICVSDTVYNSVRGKLPLEFEDLGEQEVKNIENPVRTYRVLTEPGAAAHRVVRAKRKGKLIGLAAAAVFIAVLVAAGVYFTRPADEEVSMTQPREALTLPDLPSIAVLPFTNMSGDPEQEYFSDGITDTIITDLSKLRNLVVIARNSTFAYKGKTVDVREVGRALGVRYILEGGIQKNLQKIRINVQLVDTVTGEHLWAERYDRDFKDIFALQDEITEIIVTELDVKLVGGEAVRLFRRATENPMAYDSFLKGMEAFRRRTKEDYAIARQLFEKALEIDPDFTAAMIMMGWIVYGETVSGWHISSADSIEEMVGLANRAKAIDPTFPEAYGLLAMVQLTFMNDHEQAIEFSEQAVALLPSDSFSLSYLSLALTYSGRAEEGLEKIQQAIRLNPILAPSQYHFWGAAYLFLGKYEESIVAYRKCLDRVPNYIWCNVNIIIPYLETGREAEARAQAKEVLRINPAFDTENAVQVRRIKDPAVRARWKTLLRKAGLP